MSNTKGDHFFRPRDKDWFFPPLYIRQNYPVYAQDMKSQERKNVFEVSIQASDRHYCKPKKNNQFLSDYDSVEVCVTASSAALEKEFLSRKFSDGRKVSALLYETSDSLIGGFVPIAKMREMISMMRDLAVNFTPNTTLKDEEIHYCDYEDQMTMQF